MAGIGFELRKLVAKDDLLGLVRAMVHSALASTGPWLFTVLAIGAITLYDSDFTTRAQEVNFRIIIIYNFAFSLVMSAPVFMVATRYLADAIHRKDVTNVPGLLIGSLLLIYLTQLPIAAWFYLGYVDLPLSLRLMALVNVFLVSSLWVLGVFLTALKDYKAVSNHFGIGMLLAFALAIWFKGDYGEAGMLTGFSVGLAFIVFAMVAKVFAEYPYSLGGGIGLFGYFKRYWHLALGGFFYNAGIWVDKWIMWFAPEATELPSGMIMFPNYDSAMFLAYLTIVPAMAVFMFSVETNFFERYLNFYRDILNHATFRRIRENHREVISSLLRSGRNFLIIQAGVAFLVIMLAPQIFDLLNINFMQIGIFRFGVLGAFFHVLLLFEMIILSYFDCRRITMYSQLFFLLANTLLTIWSMNLGYEYYGYGYFLAAMLTFIVTSIALFHYLRNLPYHAFITNNTSVGLPPAVEAKTT